jgi:hypothetical protein
MSVGEGKEVPPSIKEVLGFDLSEKLEKMKIEPEEFTYEAFEAARAMLEPILVMDYSVTKKEIFSLARKRILVLNEAASRMGYIEETTYDPQSY